MNGHKAQKDRFLSEVRRDRADVYREQRELTQRRRRALDGDVHEYANFLVSSTAKDQ